MLTSAIDVATSRHKAQADPVGSGGAMPDADSNVLGTFLRSRRMALGLTLADIAYRMGRERQRLTQIENGLRIPTVDLIFDYAAVFEPIDENRRIWLMGKLVALAGADLAARDPQRGPRVKLAPSPKAVRPTAGPLTTLVEAAIALKGG